MPALALLYENHVGVADVLDVRRVLEGREWDTTFAAVDVRAPERSGRGRY
jgi:hypothetical protein